MMTYSNSPHSGRRVAYSVTRSLRCMTTVEIWHSRMRFPALPLQSAAAELVVVNLVAQHDPQANTQFVGRRNSRLAHPFLDKLATIEAFQLRIFCERKKCGVPLATVEVWVGTEIWEQPGGVHSTTCPQIPTNSGMSCTSVVKKPSGCSVQLSRQNDGCQSGFPPCCNDGWETREYRKRRMPAATSGQPITIKAIKARG